MLPTTQNRAELERFLVKHALAKPTEPMRWTPLTGGVSSEIWRVDLSSRSLCVKRALPKLKVAADWEAPVSRNTYEWHWLCFAAEQARWVAPKPLAHDEQAGMFAMTFLDPQRHPVWKSHLMNGVVDPGIAAQVGTVLGQMHEASAKRSDLAAQFDSLENFYALRLNPYLLATAERHPDLARQLESLVNRTAGTALALVHGDVSPKNILIGPQGPVFLDAECAWYGDPAFDAAFCLNHLLLKSLARPDDAPSLLQSFTRFVEAYFGEIHFESRSALEPRVAHLLPALSLARIDGKSPVEYLIGLELERTFVRRFAFSFVKNPATQLAAITAAWSEALGEFQRAGVTRKSAPHQRED